MYNDFHLQVDQNGIKATYLRLDPNHNIKKTAKNANVNFDLRKYIELSIPIEEESLGDPNKSYESQHKDMGKFLYSFLFSDAIDSFFHESFDHSIKEDSKDGLRLRLYVNDPKLSNIAWEFVYDDDNKFKQYICTLDRTPFTRFPHDVNHLSNMLILDQDNSETVNQRSTAKALFISANAIGGKNTGGEKELKNIKTGLSRTKKNALVKIIPKEPELPTWQKINDALDDNYNIVHFYGHGRFDNDEAKLIFEAPNGGEDPVRPDTFSELFLGSRSKNLCFVFLNACEGAKSSEVNARSGLAESLVSSSLSYVSTVIAMQYAITIDPAAYIAKSLYKEISKGNAIDHAVQNIRKSLRGSFEYRNKRFFATPVIFMQSKNGYIFHRLIPNTIINTQLSFNDTQVKQIPPDIIEKMKVLVDVHDNKVLNNKIDLRDFWQSENYGNLHDLLRKLTLNTIDYGIPGPEKRLINNMLSDIPDKLDILDDNTKDDNTKAENRREIRENYQKFIDEFCRERIIDHRTIPSHKVN